jgi:hypothetical protein
MEEIRPHCLNATMLCHDMLSLQSLNAFLNCWHCLNATMLCHDLLALQSLNAFLNCWHSPLMKMLSLRLEFL